MHCNNIRWEEIRFEKALDLLRLCSWLAADQECQGWSGAACSRPDTKYLPIFVIVGCRAGVNSSHQTLAEFYQTNLKMF